MCCFLYVYIRTHIYIYKRRSHAWKLVVLLQKRPLHGFSISTGASRLAGFDTSQS